MKNIPTILIAILFVGSSMLSWVTKPDFTYVANDDIYYLKGRMPIVMDVLANDEYEPNSLPKITSVTQPKHGKVIINPDSTTLTYIPFKRRPLAKGGVSNGTISGGRIMSKKNEE